MKPPPVNPLGNSRHRDVGRSAYRNAGNSDYRALGKSAYRRWEALLTSSSVKNVTVYKYSTLDLFPTTLAALGCTIRGDRLGLGTNLYSKMPTLIEKEGLRTCINGLTPQSGFLNSYSNTPTGEELVRKVLSSQRLKLTYTEDYEGESGFLLNCLSHFNNEVIESARLELTDLRTGVSQTYPMNERRSINLFAPMTLSRSELLHLRARAYVKVTDAQETLFATYEPPAITPAKNQPPTHLSEE